MKKVKNKICLSIFVFIMMVVVGATASACTTNTITENISIENGILMFEKIAGAVLPSTVTVTCTTRSGGTAGGAGVVVSSDGYVLTNYHVIKDANGTTATIKFTDEEGDITKYTAEILSEKNDGSSYSKMDLALLKISGKNFTPVKLKADKVKWGESGLIVGNPKQLGSLCAHAYVSHPGRKVNHEIKNTKVNLVTEMITLDAPVNPGNSGGGFFDARGRLAGIVTLRQSVSDTNNENVVFGIGYAIPASSIKGYLARYNITLEN